MKFIATDVNDSPARLAAAVAQQRDKTGRAMDAYFYRSHIAYQKELDQIVFRSWLYAGHSSQIPNPGDYLLFDIASESVIVVRQKNGEIHALLNVCRHRGSRVCRESTGSARKLVCPYHAWTYELDGSLASARSTDGAFDKRDYGLKTIQARVLHGLIFVNFDASASGFEIRFTWGALKIKPTQNT